MGVVRWAQSSSEWEDASSVDQGEGGYLQGYRLLQAFVGDHQAVYVGLNGEVNIERQIRML